MPGEVARAVGGERHRYQPSVLSGSLGLLDPLELLELLTLLELLELWDLLAMVVLLTPPEMLELWTTGRQRRAQAPASAPGQPAGVVGLQFMGS